ncbi:ATP-binding protein [Nocardia sp. NEAU-G5]|uniref:ATP-binding protein n=1 Tax=Nocardia albiluteola TaxID=2842303 RepID=A0ABS6BB28_9NOCA|nr:ATP-binding protein [Nocardia albiluteola]MBU3066418.1 ATP-binding protein [Nocardia albiluteola]
MRKSDASGDADMIVVRLLEDVFSTGKTPEATYTPRFGEDPEDGTFDDQLRGKARRRNGGVMLSGVSKSGKTSLVERVLPEDQACWLQGTRINSIDDFWLTLAQQLSVSDKNTSQISTEESESEGLKFEAGFRSVMMASADSSDGSKTGRVDTWSYSSVPAHSVEQALSESHRPIVVDDFHHISSDVRAAIARAIKPLLRNTFIVLVAIPSYSFDPAKTVVDIGGRMVHFKIPEWTMPELISIAQRGFSELNLIDRGDVFSGRLAQCSFGSPHVMQELCYEMLSQGLKVHETVATPQQVEVPQKFDRILRTAATASEPFAFHSVLSGKNTKGVPRNPVVLNNGDETDIYGIVMFALAKLIPPSVLKFTDIRKSVHDLTKEAISKQRITAALNGMSSEADKNKRDADPIFSYREEVAYIEDPLFAFYLKYGDWTEGAIQRRSRPRRSRRGGSDRDDSLRKR